MTKLMKSGRWINNPDEVRRVFAMHDNPERRAKEAELFINGNYGFEMIW